MDNYIQVFGKRIELTKEQIEQLKKELNVEQKLLSGEPVGAVVKIGRFELIVLEQNGDTTALICRNFTKEKTEFGGSNNYNGSKVDGFCNEFASELAGCVGEENVVEHSVDLTSDDGLKDYGNIRRKASLMTADMYRRYVDILDGHKIEKWWWLATPHSTKRHGDEDWVKCVSPSGRIYGSRYYGDDLGVRPFCILKSNIFVSE